MIVYQKDDKCEEVSHLDFRHTVVTLLWHELQDWRRVRGLYALEDELCLQVTSMNDVKWELRHLEHPMLYWSVNEDMEDGYLPVKEGWSLENKAPIVTNFMGSPIMDDVEFSFAGFPILFEEVAYVPSEKEKRLNLENDEGCEPENP